LAVALSTTLNATSANAWPARPFQALPRQIPGSILLRVFHGVPSDVVVRADCVLSCPGNERAAVLVIETDSISAIGPRFHAKAQKTHAKISSVLNSFPLGALSALRLCGFA
jgi:hypothetical protein